MIEENKTTSLRKAQPLKSTWMILLAAGLFLVGTATVLSLSDAQNQALLEVGASAMPVKVEYPAPELALTDLEGNPVSLQDYEGWVVLVNNWATWCPPCKAEMPSLQKFYESFADEGFIIIAIESGEPADEVTAFVRQYGLTFPVWLDMQGEALHAFQNFDLPSSYVIDRDGTIQLMWTGAISQGMLERYVAPMIEE